MFHKAYECLWCKADLKSKEIPFMAKAYYNESDTHFSNAIELINKGWECPQCNCRWTYEGKIFREGIPELKDKYKTEEIIEEIKKESVVEENTTTESNSENNSDDNNLNNESEEY